MKYRNLSPDEAAVGGGTAEAPVTPHFGMLSEEMFEPTYDPSVIKAEKEIEKKVEEEVKEQAPEGLSLEKQEESGEEKKEEKVEGTESKETEVKETELELSLEGIEPLTLEPESKVWQETAKDLFGVEVAEDTHEAFVAAAKQAIQLAEEKGKQATIDSELAKLPVEAQVDFLLLQAGYTREEINEPTKEIDTALAMANIDLVKYDMELKGYSPEMIEREIEELTAKGLIDHEAEKHRLFLNGARVDVLNERADLANKVATSYQAKLQAEKEAELQTMTQAFDTVKNFMGHAVNENTRKEMARLYSEGKYDSVLNDPIKRAEFLMYHNFGEKVLNNIRNKAMEEGREKVTKHLSNIPPSVQSNNAKVNLKTQEKSSAGFDGLGRLFPD